MSLTLDRLRTMTQREPLVARGVAFMAVAALLLTCLVLKTSILATLRGGETISAEFPMNYNLRVDKTRVKLAGLQVGIVTGVRQTSRGTAVVTMKVDSSALDDLGPKPTAAIDPLTILGGQNSVNLKHGGGEGTYNRAKIPLDRTYVASELDRILEAFPTDTREALQGVVSNTADALQQGTTASLRGLIKEGPAAFDPAGRVFDAAQGRHHSDDLLNLVESIHNSGHVLAARSAQLGSIIENLDATTAVLARESGPIAKTVSRLPQALDRADTGLTSLRATLHRLDTASSRLRPTAREAGPLMKALDPALKELRPLIRDLKPTLRDARPLVRDLVPVSKQATQILRNLRGPVLDGVNGPIMSKLKNTWRGKNEYRKSGGGVQADHKFYEEIGYMVANLDRSSMVQDAQGSLLNFAVGVGFGSLQPTSLEDMLEQITAQILRSNQ